MAVEGLDHRQPQTLNTNPKRYHLNPGPSQLQPPSLSLTNLRQRDHWKVAGDGGGAREEDRGPSTPRSGGEELESYSPATSTCIAKPEPLGISDPNPAASAERTLDA